jgi:hypothetical protein
MHRKPINYRAEGGGGAAYLLIIRGYEIKDSLFTLFEIYFRKGA